MSQGAKESESSTTPGFASMTKGLGSRSYVTSESDDGLGTGRRKEGALCSVEIDGHVRGDFGVVVLKKSDK